MFTLSNIGKYGILFKVAVTLFFIALPTLSVAKSQCSIALVIAQDVSGSVDSTEFHLQKDGLANAFRDPEVIDLIELLPGGAYVAVTQWSGQHNQRLAIGWTHILTTSDANSFAERIDNDRRVRSRSLTAIGQALLQADHLLRSKMTVCKRKVIDVSSDGRNNTGPDASMVADALALKGIIINALVIAGQDTSLITYFQQEIIRGPEAFIQPAIGYRDYAKAIKHKLLRELTPALAKNVPNQSIYTNINKFASIVK
jgi:Ca-activated chloride channel family protein